MIDLRFFALQDCDYAVCVATLVEEAFGSLKERRNLGCVLSREDEELEARIGGR